SAITLCKRNPMPESTDSRPTSATEMMFLLTKAPNYFYDNEAVREDFADERMGNPGTYQRTSAMSKGANHHRQDLGFLNNGKGWNADGTAAGRNMRNWRLVTSEPTPELHFATFGQSWIMPYILAGTSAKGECVACGKNWVRVTEQSRATHPAQPDDWHTTGRGGL